MANLNSVLNERISRVSRKQIRAETGTTRRLASQHRRDIAALKRLIADLHKRLAFLEKAAKRMVTSEPMPEPGEKIRFRSDGLSSHRKRLGLSAANFGKLVGVSGLTVYAWESGKFRPRRQQLIKLVAARKLGKREAEKRLALLK